MLGAILRWLGLVAEPVQRPTVVVQTKLGPVRGEKKGVGQGHGGAVLVFEGIPYATPPVGKLRFKRPQPMAPWSEVLDCR